jgi:hypothetical protein
MKAKIFGIGISKTGTTSLHAALEILGYRSVHFPVTMSEIDSHDAASDISVACRFAELDKLYPGSKFILTVRDLNQWLDSCDRHFSQRSSRDKLSPKSRDFIVSCIRKVYGTAIYDPVLFKEAYQKHIQHVQDYFAKRPQDLLNLNIAGGEGWERLCPFVRQPVLKLPFPYKNKNCESLDMIRQEISSKLDKDSDSCLL